ncbi:HPr kinase/phosphorylase [Croceibacterium aestuarii]|uniref:HPr kinase/phosphorylase n=1 Tax=Croceibacterium aestuarii TaxID=3064139 RepID=UPI00272E24B5|nr:serine kinase [Croceibacterium sp. D39]
MSDLLANVSCVAVDGRAVLVVGPPGSGKSSLALALIDRGAVLVGDDGVRLEARDGRCWACPPPHVAGKLEIRNVGLIEFPTAEAPLALAVRLDPAAPRFVETATPARYADHTVPEIALYPDAATLALRLEWALRLHGTR